MEIFPLAETLKVGAAYAALLYIWPNIVFRSLLRGRGLTFRFLFCAMVQPLIICAAVLLLGLFHILNAWVVRLLFWGALAASFFVFLRGRRGQPPCRAGEALGALGKDIWRKYRKNLAEYIALAAILLFAAAFFLSGAFHDYSFGFYDQYTHYNWASALVKGQIFPAGIYPMGMHCFLYGLRVLFGIKLYSSMVFLGGLHNATMFLLGAYCLLKELLRSRWAGLFVLAAWAVFDGIGPNAISAMARMSWTLPEEFGLYLVFLCPLVLLRYFRSPAGQAKWYRDENLLFLGAGVALAFSTHFYVLAMAFLPCCAVVLANCVELRPIRRLAAPVCTALGGLVVGLLPMVAAYAMGMELEGSIGWGIRTIFGKSAESAVASAPAAGPAASASAGAPAAPAPTVGQGTAAARPGMLKGLYEEGWSALFGNVAAVLLLLAVAAAILFALACMCARLRKKPTKRTLPAGTGEGYLILALSLGAFVLLYAMPYMGLPELVRNVRTLCVTQLLAFAMGGAAADALLLLARHKLGRKLPGAVMALGCVLIYCIAFFTDFHQTTYWWLFRYNAAVTVTDRITEEYRPGTYKIVSLWDEASQADEADTEELLLFMERAEQGEDPLPAGAEYVFLYVEKNPIWWGQVHFSTAPRWLARENEEVYWPEWSPSRCPEIWCVEVSPKLALKEIDYGAVRANYYGDMEMRMVLSAKAYAWYGEFASAHPENTEVYYEDEDFACYLIRQNAAAQGS